MDTVTVTSDDRNIFQEAYRLFSGRETAIIHSKDYKWNRLIWRLKSAGNSPYEFFHYIVYHHGEINPVRATYKNLLVTDKVWWDFKAFKKKRPLQIQGLIRSQREGLLAEIKLHGNAKKVLLNPSIPISSPVILDTALLLKQGKSTDVEDILNKFLADAVFVIYCSPEFLEYCMHLKYYMRKNELW